VVAPETEAFVYVSTFSPLPLKWVLRSSEKSVIRFFVPVHVLYHYHNRLTMPRNLTKKVETQCPSFQSRCPNAVLARNTSTNAPFHPNAASSSLPFPPPPTTNSLLMLKCDTHFSATPFLGISTEKKRTFSFQEEILNRKRKCQPKINDPVELKQQVRKTRMSGRGLPGGGLVRR
jgi:hypothetical protein